MRKSVVIAVLVGVPIMVVHLAVGMREPPTPIVMAMEMMMVMFFLLCGRIAHPIAHRSGPIPLRWHQTCQSGTRRTERANKPMTAEASPIDLRTSKCARFF